MALAVLVLTLGVLMSGMGYPALRESLTLSGPFGQVKGVVIKLRDFGCVYAFLGICYAQPPTGALRFKKPVRRRAGGRRQVGIPKRISEPAGLCEA